MAASSTHSEPHPNARAGRAVAVALRDAAASGRPRILASGYGAVAERILAIAFDEGIKVREDADLAETLAALEIGREIPLEAFAAIAEILSYVYAVNEAARGGQASAPRPGSPVEAAP
jgi:flagellar biosynthesis protein